LFEAFDIRETVSTARALLGADHQVADLIVQLERQVNEGVERVQEVFSRLLMSAGLGQMVDVVIHEIGAPTGKINRQLILLERAIRDSSDLKVATATIPMMTAIKGWLEQVHNLRQRLDPQTAGKRGRATKFSVGDEVDDTFRLYETILASQQIKWEIDCPDGPQEVFMSRAALGQILANLVDNAIYWLIRGREASAGRRISATVRASATGFDVTISDNGPGVPEEDQRNIFEPYFTRKPNGIGLGLYIARLVIEPYGHLAYVDDGPLHGACFQAVFERGVGK
jgi:hypothetical protein